MVGPSRPLFVLFGSSIVELSYSYQGWGATLSGLYSRKADILVRGYSGWTSRLALTVLDQVFPKDAEIQPSLVILYFGGNDSVDPEFPGSPHVPLQEYVENMEKIALHIKSLSAETRLIFLSTPPVNEEQILQFYGNTQGRTNETSGIYSEACKQLGQKLGEIVVDVWSSIQERPDWLTTCFLDGMHLSKEGSEIMAKKILRALKEADWKPSLHWTTLPNEFGDIITPLEMNPDRLKEYE